MSQKYLVVSIAFLLSATLANAQVVVEYPKLVTPGLHVRFGGETQELELQTIPVWKDAVHMDALYTFNRTLMLGVKTETGRVQFGNAQSNIASDVAVYGKVRIFQSYSAGGVSEVSLSVETVIRSTVSVVPGVKSGSIVEQQLRIAPPRGSTRATLAWYHADGPFTALIGAQVQFNRPENGLKLGDSAEVNVGFNSYLLPYATSDWQIIAGVEASAEVRQPLCGCTLSVADTGGSGAMISPTLRVVVSPQFTIFGAVSIPVVERYGAAELTRKRNVKVGVTYAF